MIKTDKLFAVVFFLVFLCAFVMSYEFPASAQPYVQLVNTLGMGLSSILLISAFWRQHRKDDKKLKPLTKHQWSMITVLSVSMIVYVLLIRIVGYAVMTAVYLFSMIIYLTMKKPTMKQTMIALAVSLVTTLLLYFIFVRFLYIPLPEGFLL